VSEVVEAYLERIASLDPVLESFVTVTPDTAVGNALELERRKYSPSLPLFGVPIAPKDLFWTSGVRTTAGSKVLAEWVPDKDATAVARLKAAGAISLGKVNTHEFAFGGTTQTWEKKTKNPWDHSRVPGGSSGGSAAALAADLCGLSIVTDTGGSARIPAHCCGVVGFKPTYGRVSRFGVIPLSWNLDHVAPMARTVEDAALALQVLAGPDPLDQSSLKQPAMPDLMAQLGAGIQNVRIGVPNALIESLCAPAVLRRFQSAIETFSKEGAQVVDVELFDFDLAEGAQWTIITCDAAAYMRPILRQRPTELGADVRNLLVAGERLSGPGYIRAQQIRRLVCRHFQDLLAGVDMVAMPVMSTLAPRLIEATGWSMEVNGRSLPLFTVFTGLCLYANLTGLPALAVPVDTLAGEPPVAMQLIGRYWDEASLARVGYAYQRVIGWAEQRPRYLPLLAQ
jgi:aspartyl-tRNA(Asn)/glutamyl-tRNA(Gln) amidotransferase subunit A